MPSRSVEYYTLRPAKAMTARAQSGVPRTTPPQANQPGAGMAAAPIRSAPPPARAAADINDLIRRVGGSTEPAVRIPEVAPFDFGGGGWPPAGATGGQAGTVSSAGAGPTGPAGGSAFYNLPAYDLPERVAPLSVADRTAANAAGFSRAKEQIGQVGSGAMRSLQNRLGTMGREGTAYGERAAGTLMGATAADLSETVRRQTEADLAAESEVAGLNYQGAIGQRAGDINAMLGARGQDVGMRGAELNARLSARGQDIGAREGRTSAQLTQRGQNLSTQQARLNLLPSLYSLYNRAY